MYYKHRPTIGIKEKDLLKIDAQFGWHKSMSGMKRLYDEGKVAIVQGVGYDQPSFSHFTSMSFWHTAAPEQRQRVRLDWPDRVGAGSRPARAQNMIVNISDSQTLAVKAEKHVPLVFIDPDAVPARRCSRRRRRSLDALGAPHDAGRRRAPVRARGHAGARRRPRRWCAPRGASTRARPIPDLRLLDLDKVAALIEADFPTRLYYVPLRSSLFDTHVNQAAPHDRQLQYCSDAIAGFFQEMQRIGRADDVVMYVHSEFGRRVPENTSLGTDHGTAQVNFVIGNAVKGGLYGKPPSLTNLVLGDNLENTTDFRQVYATLIEEWMGADAAKVLGTEVRDAEACSARSGWRRARWPLASAGRPGPASWKDDLTPIARRRLELRPRRAPAGARGIRRHAGRDPEAGRRRPRARRPLARALRAHPESEDAAVRRIGAVGSDAERLSREPARSDRSGAEATAARWASTTKPAGNRPVQPVSDRFFYWLRATMLETRRLGYWWANRMLQTTHPVRAEDGAAVARPLRHPREQGPRLPQDAAADRPVRAGRDRQPARPDHQGRAEPGDALLPRRAVQRQGRRRTRTSPAR